MKKDGHIHYGKKTPKPNEQLARAIIEQCQPKSVADMQDALKDIFGPMFEAMLVFKIKRLTKSFRQYCPSPEYPW